MQAYYLLPNISLCVAMVIIIHLLICHLSGQSSSGLVAFIAKAAALTLEVRGGGGGKYIRKICNCTHEQTRQCASLDSVSCTISSVLYYYGLK